MDIFAGAYGELLCSSSIPVVLHARMVNALVVSVEKR
jgi:hypothetical protein